MFMKVKALRELCVLGCRARALRLLLILLMAFVSVHATGYSDLHNDGVLTGWTSDDSRCIQELQIC